VLIRPVERPEDLSALDELFETIHRCDGHAPIGEHKYLDLQHADPAEDVGLVGEIDGSVVAYVALGETGEPKLWAMEAALHPLQRDHETSVQLVRAGFESAVARGAARVRCWAFQPNLALALEQVGFEPERELRQLRLELPAVERPRFPSAVSLRPFRPGVDEEAWLRVNNAAFEGHPENGSWTMGVLADREQQDWFDPDGFRMCWEGDELAAFCWTKVHEGDVGEIYVIGVAPDHQGRGLGKAMVLEGLNYLAEDRGLTRGMLYVDADNERALELYHRLGFRLDHVDRSLVKKVDSR
jgi:mycothiol synthase